MKIPQKLCSSMLIFIALFSTFSLRAQDIPENIEFAGITLQIKPSAKPIIRNQVNLLLENREDFRKQVKVADTFMPLISEILQKNGLPDDFKYLALADNTDPDSLIFWQMAEKFALDLGLKVNESVDERQNLYTVSEKVSGFLKTNHMTLQNWWLTLLSYQFKNENPQEAFKKLFPNTLLSELSSKKEFQIDENTHPQILQLMTRALAYSKALSTDPRRDVELVNFTEASNLSLAEVAQNFSLSLEDLKRFNPWLKAPKVPQDKKYDLIIPMPGASPSAEVQLLTAPNGEYEYVSSNESYVHVVESGETLYKISRQYQVSIQDLMKWNRLNQNSVILVGQKLYIADTESQPEIKNTPIPTEKQALRIHQVQKGETLYRISRQYKVRVEDIRLWNHLQNDNLYVGQNLQIQVQSTEAETTNPILIPNQNNQSPSNTSTNPIPTVENPQNPTPTNPVPVNPPQQQGGIRTIKPKQIPDVIEVGGISLKITREGKKALKKDVDMLIKSPTYFFNKLNRVDLYFPLITDALRDQNLPDDFKYLPVQESALIAAAISPSNAVGYWQFKEDSGTEMGLNINNRVDERMNIVASSEAAGKYLKRNNLYFNNWIITLLSYNLGFSGAKLYMQRNYPDLVYRNLKEMEIDENTHWYIRKFIAHKIAFEQEIGLDKLPKKLQKYTEGSQKTLNQIADEFRSSEEEMQPYNLWLKKNRIPDDKTYTVIVPLNNQ